ncbi:MAG TPA: hypothetical protein VLC08_06705 [Chitinolyticbacter sp.]|nr:hypothetical protein [Chitinolyticbacter sp.]
MSLTSQLAEIRACIHCAAARWPGRWPPGATLPQLCCPYPIPQNIAGFQRNAWFASDVLAQLRRRLDELGLFQRR